MTDSAILLNTMYYSEIFSLIFLNGFIFKQDCLNFVLTYEYQM